MHELQTELAMSHPPERVWSLIGQFGALRDWLPGVRDCVVEEGPSGTERIVELDRDQRVRERLLAHSDEERWYRYSVLEAPGFQPGMEFVATLSVQPGADGGSRVQWSARFSLPQGMPEQAAELVSERARAMYDASLAHLETCLNTA